jgi:hypothetical protein
VLAKKEVSVGNRVSRLFGPPPLIRGEKEADYWRLWDAFAADLNPKSWSEYVVVNDLAYKYWEQLRLRRYSQALTEGACIEALEFLLRPFLIETEDPDMKNASSKIARFYYVGINGAKLRAKAFVAECGITPDQIYAQAMQMRGPGLLMFDRMDTTRENACRALRKEMQRRAASSESDPANSSDQEN